MTEPQNFVIRGEHILLGFLRAFFAQDVLFEDYPNDFQYTYGKEEKTLIIQMTGDFDHETPDALPALTIQEGGFNEQWRRIDQLTTWDWDGNEYHKTNWRHPYTIHCITRFRGTSKLLQGLVARAITSFRQAIYQMGVDKIFSIQGNPPVNLSNPTDSRPDSHDAAISMQMQLANDWKLESAGDPVEEVFVRAIGIVNRTQYDANGNPIFPPDIFDRHGQTRYDSYLEHTVTVDNKFEYDAWMQSFLEEVRAPAAAIWGLNEEAGVSNAVDRIGEFNLVYFGDPSRASDPLVSDAAHSVELDQDDTIKHADLGAGFHPGAHSFSFGGWFSGSSPRQLMGVDDAVTYAVSIDNAGSFVLDLTDDAGESMSVTGPSADEDAHFIVGVWDAENQEAVLYVDAEASSEGEGLSNFSSGVANLTIEGPGRVDALFFTPHRLNAEEIKKMHSVGREQ